MIISKTPYRLPISGGGTDIDFYYRKHGGRLISISVDQYVYVLLMKRKIEDNYLIQTTSTQFEKNIKSIKHQLIRETLIYYNIKEKLHIATYSTVPTQTGLGTSSAMIVGLINCLNKYKNLKLTKIQIVKDAYKIERKICKLNGGWQDQIVSQYGGILDITISKTEEIKIKKIKLQSNIKKIVKNNFLLVYTQVKRDSSEVITSQKKNKSSTIKYYNIIKELNDIVLKYIKQNNIVNLGKIFNEHWDLKKNLTNQMSSKSINIFFESLINNYNITGGKLIGAGGGGFFLVVTKNKKKLKSELLKNKIKYIDLEFESNGSRIIY